MGHTFSGLKKHYGSDTKLAVANKRLSEHLGKEDKVLGENMVPYVMAPDTVYSRRSEFSNVRVPVIYDHNPQSAR